MGIYRVYTKKSDNYFDCYDSNLHAESHKDAAIIVANNDRWRETYGAGSVLLVTNEQSKAYLFEVTKRPMLGVKLFIEE